MKLRDNAKLRQALTDWKDGGGDIWTVLDELDRALASPSPKTGTAAVPKPCGPGCGMVTGRKKTPQYCSEACCDAGRPLNPAGPAPEPVKPPATFDPERPFLAAPREGACQGCGRLRDVDVGQDRFCSDCRSTRNWILYGQKNPCRACGEVLTPGNFRVADGCPCNSGRGVNHGLVPILTCTCVECDPEQTGSSRDVRVPARTPAAATAEPVKPPSPGTGGGQPFDVIANLEAALKENGPEPYVASMTAHLATLALPAEPAVQVWPPETTSRPPLNDTFTGVPAAEAAERCPRVCLLDPGHSGDHDYGTRTPASEPGTGGGAAPFVPPAPSECPGCAKVQRHPGEGYVCAWHMPATAVPAAEPGKPATCGVNFVEGSVCSFCEKRAMCVSSEHASICADCCDFARDLHAEGRATPGKGGR